MFRVKYYCYWDSDLQKYTSEKEYTVFSVDNSDEENIYFLVYDNGWTWIGADNCEPIYN